jgi:hypothetical protein
VKTLREIGEFVGIPQGAADRFTTHEPISLELAGRLVTLLDRTERTSMRAMTAALERLPPVTLEAKLTSASSGEAPLPLVIVLAPNNAAIISTTVNGVESGSGKVFQVADFFLEAPSAQAGDVTRSLVSLGDGTFLITVDRTGVGDRGFVRLSQSFRVVVSKAPLPPPVEAPPSKAPDPVRPAISVTSGGDGSFKVSGKDFVPKNATVNILVGDKTLNQNPTVFVVTAENGAFTDFPTGKICQRHGILSFEASDGRIVGGVQLFSNTVELSCPF